MVSDTISTEESKLERPDVDANPRFCGGDTSADPKQAELLGRFCCFGVKSI
jgi:hypothetical protein